MAAVVISHGSNDSSTTDRVAWRMRADNGTVSHARDELDSSLQLVRRKLQEKYATLRELKIGMSSIKKQQSCRTLHVIMQIRGQYQCQSMTLYAKDTFILRYLVDKCSCLLKFSLQSSMTASKLCWRHIRLIITTSAQHGHHKSISSLRCNVYSHFIFN